MSERDSVWHAESSSAMFPFISRVPFTPSYGVVVLLLKILFPIITRIIMIMIIVISIIIVTILLIFVLGFTVNYLNAYSIILRFIVN